VGFFSKRSAAEPSGQASAAADTVAQVRRRAKHRLIGAVALVAVAVVVFPLLFESKPRPLPMDLPIEIPRKEGAAPLSLPPARVAEAPGATAPAASPASAPPPAEAKPEGMPEPKAQAKAEPKGDAKAPTAPDVKAEPKPDLAAKAEPKVDTKPAAKVEQKAELKVDAKTDDAARAKALLEGRTPAPPMTPAAPGKEEAKEATGRFVVQAGAYTDAAKVREVRQKIEKAGFKTFTQVVKSAEGERTRVRIGPYPTRAEADKAAAKLKELGVDVGVLKL
jgi:DedD protein